MKFNTDVPFPPFWFETGLSWGQCDSVEDLVHRIGVYYSIDPSERDTVHILHRCRNAASDVGGGVQDLSNFGSRIEHIHGTTTLWDHLVNHKVIEP